MLNGAELAENLKVVQGLNAQKAVDKEIDVLNSSGWVLWLQERTVAVIVAEISCSFFNPQFLFSFCHLFKKHTKN